MQGYFGHVVFSLVVANDQLANTVTFAIKLSSFIHFVAKFTVELST